MRAVGAVVLCCALAVACGGAVSETQPAGPDSELWKKLTDIDSRAGRIQSLEARFEQQKLTALLNTPLVSTGSVRICGARIRWDTEQPEKSVLLIDQQEAKIFYPVQKTLEIYPLDQRLGELAASPLPRLEMLKKRFSIQQIPVKELLEKDEGGRSIALSLSPTDPSLRQHVQQVRVLLDIPAAYIVKAEITDTDGDRTLLSFSNVQINANVGDLNLTIPPGTAVSHPLEGLDGSQKPQSPSK
jgi:outer membrane lipoprotein-sorting protein